MFFTFLFNKYIIKDLCVLRNYLNYLEDSQSVRTDLEVVLQMVPELVGEVLEDSQSVLTAPVSYTHLTLPTKRIV